MTEIENNSKLWWISVKNDETLLNEWLIKQYRGERQAAEKIDLLYMNDLNNIHAKTLALIAQQEEKHASWIMQLMDARNIGPDNSDPHQRYWKETMSGMVDFEHTTALAAHAENMRLARIRAIVNDEESPADIRDVFSKILKEEEFHERAFKSMTTDEIYENTKTLHESGMRVLGLVE